MKTRPDVRAFAIGLMILPICTAIGVILAGAMGYSLGQASAPSACFMRVDPASPAAADPVAVNGSRR